MKKEANLTHTTYARWNRLTIVKRCNAEIDRYMIISTVR